MIEVDQQTSWEAANSVGGSGRWGGSQQWGGHWYEARSSHRGLLAAGGSGPVEAVAGLEGSDMGVRMEKRAAELSCFH